MIPVIVVLLQIFIPLVLLARLFEARRRSLLAWVTFTAGLVIYIAAIAVAGLWLALPWYTALAYLFIVAIAVLWRADDLSRLRWRPVGRFAYVELAMVTLLFAGAGALLAESVVARRAVAAPALNLSFPLNGGTYYVANGGSGELTNAHIMTLGDRFREYRGQSYGVDIVRVDERGLRASGLGPADLDRYVSVGEPVLAPCAGTVIAAQDGAPDMPPPTPDREHMAGNFVLLNCGSADVLLGHLGRGSVGVMAGQTVTTGQRLGAIGNSGNSEEPHLHVHAQRAAARARSLLDAEPVPVTFYGRTLARNDVVRTGAVPPPALTETEMLYGQLGSTIVALLMLIISVRARTAGRLLFSLLFAWAAVTNARTALVSPAEYLGFAGLTVSEVYRWFILGYFAQHITAFVTMIAAGQAWIAVALLRGRWWQRVGLVGAIVFLLAITPFGVGSGFPATLIMALGAGVLWREPAKPRTVIQLVPTQSESYRRAA